MNLAEDIRPLFNLAIATFAIAHLRYVATEQLLSAKTTPEGQKNNDANTDMQRERIRSILESFQNQTANENEIQTLLREVRDYLHNTTTKMLFGCRTADLELAVQALLMPKTTMEMFEYGKVWAHKSKEFNRFLKRMGGVEFNGSLLKTMHEHYVTHDETAATDADDDDDKPFSSIRGRPSTTTTVCPPMLVGCNDYRVDSGPWGKELVYMIFLDKLHKRIIVTFRGSITLSDWAHDMRVNMQCMNNPFYSGPSESVGGGSGRTGSRSSALQEHQLETIRIHSGFYKYLCMPTPAGTASRRNVVNDGKRESKFDEVLGKLKELLQENPNFKLVVTGHSLGGAASTLFALMAATAAATSATRDDGEDSKRKPDDESNDFSEKDEAGDGDDKKEEGLRMWLPTKAKVARLFGYDTETPPVAPTSDANEENSPDGEKEKEEVGVREEESFFHIRLPTPITVVSFGSPMVGDSAFSQAFSLLEEQGILRHLRVTNVDDIVPSIPFSTLPTEVQGVYLYRHVGIQLIQLAQVAPIRKFFRWSRRSMNRQNKDDEDEDAGTALFRICFPDKTNRTGSTYDWKITEEMTVVAEDVAKAARDLHFRTPINHKPAKYHKRLSRIEEYLRELSLDQLYQEYLNCNNSNDKGETKSKSPFFVVEKQSALDTAGEIKIPVHLSE